jgi:hypothetical protein
VFIKNAKQVHDCRNRPGLAVFIARECINTASRNRGGFFLRQFEFFADARQFR